MDCNRCGWCGGLFWADDPEQGMCPSCQEGPSERENDSRAWNRELATARKRRAAFPHLLRQEDTKGA